MDWQTLVFIVVATTLMLVIARLVNQLFMKARLTDALIQHDNAAVGIEISGYVMGVVLIIGSVLHGPGLNDIFKDFLLVAGYGTGGIFFLALVTSMGLGLFLDSRLKQTVTDGNIAGGITAGASYVATSLVLSGIFSGEGGGNALTAIAFFFLGQVTLLGCTYLFRFLTKYDDAEEILAGNNAAALSYAGMMIAVGIIVGNALNGTFIGYAESFSSFSASLVAVFAFYPIRQFLVQGILLGGGFSLYGGRLDEEISKDRNIAAGVIEAMSYIAAALFSTHLLS